MRPLRAILAATLAVAGVLAGAASQPPRAPTLHGCTAGYLAQGQYVTEGPGPLRFSALSCPPRPSGFSTLHGPVLSPDLRAIAWLGGSGPLLAAPMAGGPSTSYPVNLGTFAQFGGMDVLAGPDSIRWDLRGRAIWTAVQDRQRNGWATGPMRPVRALPDGRLQPLPALVHRAGPLDGLLWVGREGRALAQLGTNGEGYRPTHVDHQPTLAMVDAARGRVLDTVLLREIGDPSRGRWAFTTVSAVVLPDGRLRAVFRSDAGHLVVWTQGQTPRRLADPYPGERMIRLQLTPDGRRALILRTLPASAMCRRIGGCTHGPPVTGPIAALHELSTGRKLWELRATDVWPTSYPAAVSPDGRLALIRLPAAEDLQRFGVVSMADGRLLQTVRVGLNSEVSLGFSDDGRRAWVSSFGVAAVYDISSARP